MTRLFSTVLMASVALAQGPLQDILAALNAENLTTLANTAQNLVNTTAGQQIVSLLSSGEPVTIFAPDNNAFTGVPKNISDNAELFAEVLSYHVLPGSFNFSFFGPNANTIIRTALNASDQVFLDPGQNQVLACRGNGGNVKVLNQNTDVEAYNSTQIAGTNVTLNKVNAVIDLPGAFDAIFASNNLTAFSAAAQEAGILGLLNFTHGITIFAPTNDAFEKALAQLGGTASNISQTTLRNVLLNHVLNGTVVYSSEFSAGTKYVSALGETLTITSSSNTTSPALGISSSGNSTSNASFVSYDFISWSGSLHIIDAVLLNNNTDPSAASSAFNSATASAASVASAQATATTPAGGLVGSAGSGASETGSGRGAKPTGAATTLKADGLNSLLGLLVGLPVLLL